MARKPAQTGPTEVDAYEHPEARRTNIPTADGAERWADPETMQREPIVYARFAGLSAERERRNEALDPQLVWHGKDQQDHDDLVVEAPPLYIQEKIDPRVLVENLRDTAATGEPEPEMLFYDDFDGGLDELQQISYYQYDAAWSNRMILGDSLQAMGSLAERERLRGKVQMIYIDPPYGIKFNSNWQVSASKRDVKDGKDAAREVEQIKAFRDTWKDGIHTYLSYLRDRLVVARDLLTESGSVFVQIGDEHVHRVRAILDEIFGAENFMAQISFATTSGFSQSAALGRMGDLILWYAKSVDKAKVRQLRQESRVETGYRWVMLPDGTRRLSTKAERDDESLLPAGAKIYRNDNLRSQAAGSSDQAYEYLGHVYRPGRQLHWKPRFPEGLDRLAWAHRIHAEGSNLEYVRYADDSGWAPYTNVWNDTIIGGFTDEKVYVVQTTTKVIGRCMLMCTDPGDLVLDPTCGSGTTAYVAEQWGRRWITIDTSRVALALARQRLMGGRYPYYLLADSPEGRAKEAQVSGKLMPPADTKGDISQGFVYERVQHITLKSIANNPDIHEGMTRDEIDAAIKKHADFELLYDKPYEDKKKVRVTGRFTVESLSPYRTLDQDGEASRSELAGSSDAMGADYAQTIIDNLRSAGIQNGRRKERIEFATLDEWGGTHVQAIGERANETDDAPAGNVAIAIGPEYGTVSAGFVRDAAKEALADRDVDLLCVLGFSFEPNVTEVTEVEQVEIEADDGGFAHVSGERKLGRLKVLIVRMNAELLMGDALKKTGAGNLFTVFGEPDVEIRPASDGSDRIEAELFGVDVYDVAINDVRSRDTKDIALWMIDTDYNEESFFVRHCYFTGGNDPMKKLKVALKADINAEAWEQLYRTVSMPFDRPATGKIAIKVINDYGDEVMKVYEVD
ncbi:site-specific DNA-methyltransferase [Microbacterium sp. 2MCAF23]|uniref:site-specific DNA-methyltransferase n=1 Tax=Microbacterium sp. 2MCAF23 TaxID=3232985 RepID=UPI003F985A85